MASQFNPETGEWEDNPEDTYNQYLPPEYQTGQVNPDEVAQGANQGVGTPAPTQAPAGAWNEREFLSNWVKSGGNTTTQLQKFMNDNPQWSTGAKMVGRDKITDPFGRYFDVIGDVDTDRARARTGYTTDSRYSSGAKPKGNATMVASAGKKGGPTLYDNPGLKTSAGAGAGGGSGSGGRGAYSDEIYKQIMALLERGNKPVTADDPALNAQFAPVSATMQRANERAKLAAAERAAFQGVSHGGAGGALDAQHASMDENLALGEANIMSQMTTDELVRRRQDVVNALGFAQGEEARKLQLQLAQMDDAIKRAQLAQQDKHFNADLSYRNRALGQQGSQFNQGLDWQKQSFYDTFSRDNAIWEYIQSQMPQYAN